MNIHVITIFPEIFSALNYGIPRIAQEKKILNLHLYNLRDYTNDKHKTVDDRPYGGGPGMVLKVEPLRRAVKDIQSKYSQTSVIYLSPQGKQLDQAYLSNVLSRPNIVLVSGRYEGIDERFIEHDIDEELSIGNYILSGGEFPALVFIDAIARLLPGVLGDELSAELDSFTKDRLDFPHYTRPEIIDGQEVPFILLNGNHADIDRWRKKSALGKTWLKRPDLFEKRPITPDESLLLKEFQDELYSKSNEEN